MHILRDFGSNCAFLFGYFQGQNVLELLELFLGFQSKKSISAGTTRNFNEKGRIQNNYEPHNQKYDRKQFFKFNQKIHSVWNFVFFGNKIKTESIQAQIDVWIDLKQTKNDENWSATQLLGLLKELVKIAKWEMQRDLRAKSVSLVRSPKTSKLCAYLLTKRHS